MSDDILRATIRKTPGHARISLWLAALAITAAYGALVVFQLDDVARIGFGSVTALLFLWLFSWLFFRRKFQQRLSALVSHARATGQAIRAKRTDPSSLIYEVWVEEDEAHKMRVTEWIIGVLRATPGIELIERDEPVK